MQLKKKRRWTKICGVEKINNKSHVVGCESVNDICHFCLGLAQPDPARMLIISFILIYCRKSRPGPAQLVPNRLIPGRLGPAQPDPDVIHWIRILGVLDYYWLQESAQYKVFFFRARKNGCHRHFEKMFKKCKIKKKKTYDWLLAKYINFKYFF